MRAAVKDYLQYEISEGEINVLSRFFKSKYNKSQIKRIEMAGLLKEISETKRGEKLTYKTQEAKDALN